MKRRGFLGALLALIPGTACAGAIAPRRRHLLPKRPAPINSGRTRDLDVYLNGVLLVPGLSYGDYGWESASTLAFHRKLKPDDVIGVVGDGSAIFTRVTDNVPALDEVKVNLTP